MEILAIAVGAAVGSFIGNVSVFMWIGSMAKKAEQKQLEEMQRLQTEYHSMVLKERERMKNYAKMES